MENGAACAKPAGDLDDATLGRIEESRLRAIQLRGQRKAQQLGPSAVDGQLPPDEDEDVFSFGGIDGDAELLDDGPRGATESDLDSDDHASGKASSLPAPAPQQCVQRGVVDSSPALQAEVGDSSIASGPAGAAAVVAAAGASG